MKVLNLDQIVTRRDKVIVLGGKEHAMRSPSVKDFVNHARRAEEISRLSDQVDTDQAERVIEITIATLQAAFPTVSKEQFEALTLDQLNAIRAFVEEEADEDASAGEAPGEPS